MQKPLFILSCSLVPLLMSAEVQSVVSSHSSFLEEKETLDHSNSGEEKNSNTSYQEAMKPPSGRAALKGQLDRAIGQAEEIYERNTKANRGLSSQSQTRTSKKSSLNQQEGDVKKLVPQSHKRKIEVKAPLASSESSNQEKKKKIERLQNRLEQLRKSLEESEEAFLPVEELSGEEAIAQAVEDADHLKIISQARETRLPALNFAAEMPTSQGGSVSVAQQSVKMQAKEESFDPFAMKRSWSGLYATGEWIYWKFTEGGTEFAVTHDSALLGDLERAHSKKVTFDWKSGYRVGLGYEFTQKGWDLYANYTQISPHGSDTTSGSVFPLLNYQARNPVSDASFARAHWKIDFKTLDFEIGRRYLIAKSLFLRPHFGLKAAMINQHFRVKYGNTNPNFTGIPIGQHFTVKEKNDFRGIGLRAGIDSLWKMGAGFGFFGKLSGALLVSEMELRQIQNQVQQDLTPVQEINLKSEFHPIIPTVQVAFGLEWERGFMDDQVRLHFDLGFESQYWWNQNQLERFDSPTFPVYIRISEDLGLYGLTLGGRLDF